MHSAFFILQARVRCSEIYEKLGTRAKRSDALLLIFYVITSPSNIL